MRSLTNWFERHVLLARIKIALVHLVLTVMVLQLAGWLQQLPFYIPAWFFLAPMAAALLLATVSQQIKKRFAWSVRTSAGYALVRFKYAMVLFASYLLVVGWFYNDAPIQLTPGTMLHGSYAPPFAASKVVNEKSGERKMGFFKKQKEGGDPSTAQAFAIVGIILLALILTYFLLAASCSLSCSGFGTGAILVGVGGMALIIWGTVAWISHVNKVTRRKLDEQAKKAKPATSGITDTNSDSIQ
jgi:hypothetical protein